MTPTRLGDPPAWVADAVFYQIFPDRFARSGRVPAPGPLEDWDAPPTVNGFKGGDLYGVAEHLDHLVALGATAIYLNPIFSSASNHRYHTYDYLAVDPLLGGDAALRELLDAAHERGIRVVLDAVFNHASRGFWPFHHVMETGKHSPYRDWFYLHPEDLEAGRTLRAYAGESLQEALDAEWGDAHHEGQESLTTLGYRAWWDLPA
ncbi:MAG TPA: alpha-amylase family glycosyl hydrolase, partial [Candidatus Limnocylindria bacterium]